MNYLIVASLLLLVMVVYFRVAAKYSILDRPNHRSAHSHVTIRGGGIVVPAAFMLFFGTVMWSKLVHLPVDPGSVEQHFIVFGAGLLLISAISFLDDLLDLSTALRLFVHFIAVTFLFFFLGVFALPVWAIVFLYILVTGVLNAYNFMDGINGMNGLYSLATLATLWYVNQYITPFTNADFIIYPLLATLVFLFFNFRKRARCFAGDIGSFSISFWILGLLGLLIFKTGDYKYLLFLTVYGIEVVLTIFERLKLRENVLKAHRRHLYQLFANELGISHLVISSVYMVIQLIINGAVLQMDLPWWLTYTVVLLPLTFLYLAIKFPLKKKIFGSYF